MEYRVKQDNLVDLFRAAGWARENTAFEEFLRELGAKEAASTGDNDFHACFKGS